MCELLLYHNSPIPGRVENCLNSQYIKASIIFFCRCNPNQAVLTTPVVTATEENCHVEILWTTKAACPVGTSKASTFEACVAQNPLTRNILFCFLIFLTKYIRLYIYYFRRINTILSFLDNVFNLTSLAAETYYEVQSETGEVFKINVCDTVIDTKCPVNTCNYFILWFHLNTLLISSFFPPWSLCRVGLSCISKLSLWYYIPLITLSSSQLSACYQTTWQCLLEACLKTWSTIMELYHWHTITVPNVRLILGKRLFQLFALNLLDFCEWILFYGCF